MKSTSFEPFYGCIDDIRLAKNGVAYRMTILHQVDLLEGCQDMCVSKNPCAHGQCINEYHRATCDCIGTGYRGQFCEIKGKVTQGVLVCPVNRIFSRQVYLVILFLKK